MSEIICRLHVDVWVSDRPVVCWWQVTRRTELGAFYKIAGPDRVEEKRVSYKHLGRVKCQQPGVVEVWWVQPDNERIDGGERYRKALTDMMSRIEDDMLRAAGRIREIKEGLFKG